MQVQSSLKIFICVALGVLSSVVNSPLSAEIMPFTFEDLCEIPERIVLGSIASVASDWSSREQNFITTAVTVSVDKDLKGTGPNPLIVRQEGGIIEEADIRLIVEDVAEFEVAQTVVLFLMSAPGDEYTIFGGEGGKFTIEDRIVVETGQSEAEFLAQIAACFNGQSSPERIRSPAPLVPPADEDRTVAESGYSCSSGQCPNNDTCCYCDGNNIWAAHYRWPDESFPLPYAINASGSAKFDAVQQGAEIWGNQSGAYFPTCPGTTSNNSHVVDGENVVHWTSTTWSNCNQGTPKARTYGTVSGGVLVEVDLAFNDHCNWDATDPISSNALDVLSTATHEFGHWLRAKHCCCTQSTMYCRGASPGTTHRRTLEPNDVCALLNRYPHTPGRPFFNLGCWPGPGGGRPTINSYPNIGDINGDGFGEYVFTISGFGQQLIAADWRGELASGFPINVSLAFAAGGLGSMPLICDVHSACEPRGMEIFVGGASQIYGFSGDGQTLSNWPVATGGSVVSTPAGGDLDGDGVNEVIVGCMDGKVYAVNADGTAVQNWPVNIGTAIVSSPALANLDGVTGLEVIIGADDGKVYAFHADGTSVNGWPQTIGGAVRSSPVVGDLDDDAMDDLEVVVIGPNNTVYAWHDNGSAMSGFPKLITYVLGPAQSPALADLDGDGDLEILFGSQEGRLFALHHNGFAVSGWPVVSNFPFNQVKTPVIADLDNDDDIEVVSAGDLEIQAYEANGSSMTAGWPLEGGNGTQLGLGDLAGNSELELIATRNDFPSFAWDLGATSDEIEWGLFRHDRCNTGRYGTGTVAAFGGPGCAPCTADLNDDEEIEAFDLAILLGAWGPCPEPCGAGDPSDTCAADLNGDCQVEAFDLAILLGAWGPCE